MKKWKAITTIVIVFLLGVLAGALVTHKVCQQRIDTVIKGEPGSMSKFIVRRLNQELHLDGAQLEQLRAIVQETHGEMKKVRRQFRPQIEEILMRSQDRIRAILRPDQREKYEKIIAERRKKHESEETGR
jgi:hypothetical protein